MFVRHARNFDYAPWNVKPESEEKWCEVSTAFFTSLDSSYPDLKQGDAHGRFLAAEFEKDLPAGEETTTNRFIRSAAALKLGQFQASNRTLNFEEFRLPAATSASSFLGWYCNDDAHIFENCDRGEHVYEQNIAISELKDLVNQTRHPISMFVLSRSLLVDLVDRLNDDQGDATTQRVKRELYNALTNAFLDNKDEYFYTHYWVVERKGAQWMRLATVAMGSPDYEKCTNSNIDRFCESIERKPSVVQSQCDGSKGPVKREVPPDTAPLPPTTTPLPPKILEVSSLQEERVGSG